MQPMPSREPNPAIPQRANGNSGNSKRGGGREFGDGFGGGTSGGPSGPGGGGASGSGGGGGGDGGGGGRRELLAYGSMLGADADRIVLKRIVLTGYPTRVHKRHATVKYMFYNPEDVKVSV